MSRSRPNKTSRAGWIVAIVLGLLVQLPEAWLLVRAGSDRSELPPPAAVPRRTRVALVPSPPKPKPEKKPKGQVVTLPEPEKEERPDEARFLARHDHKTVKETKARVRDAGKTSRAKKRVRKRSALQSPESKDKRETKLEKTETAERASAAPDAPKDLRGAPPKHAEQSPASKALPFPKVPKAMDLRRVQTLSTTGGADDALVTVRDEGDETLLNARRYRFVVFFERVKAQVRPYWEPNEALRRRDPTGRAFCCRDRLTVLEVVLDKTGRVVELDVERSSGLPFLDREAKRAFRQASPYPNPPAELLEAGRLEFQFGFLLEFRDGRPFTRWVPPRPL